MKRKHRIAALLILVVYVSSYYVFRQSQTEIWAGDGKAYVIFPENKILYYFFRPISYLDGNITDIKFHIGPHQQ